MSRPCSPCRPWKGAAVAFGLLLIVEAWLHTDTFLYRYRSVFAAGRAMDKVLYIEAHTPRLLIIGNSRVDNGFDPRSVAPHLTTGDRPDAFNFGVPGANARDFHGIFLRLADKGLLGGDGIDHVVLGLDEGFVQHEPSLGYGVFFASRQILLEQRRFRDWLASWVRLWGYAGNLKSLHEPEKLLRFVQASLGNVEPVGGAASQHLGYRAGFGGRFQEKSQVLAQEAGSTNPPDADTLACFWAMLDLLQSRRVKVTVVFPPLLNREVLFLQTESAKAAPYLSIRQELHRRDIPTIALEPGRERQIDEFANAGHLNDKGAQRFSRLLSERLRLLWPELYQAKS
jgi:hypothetical protein